MMIDPSRALDHLGRDEADQPVVGDDVVLEDLAELRRRRCPPSGRSTGFEAALQTRTSIGRAGAWSRRPGCAARPSTRCWPESRSRGPRRARPLIAAPLLRMPPPCATRSRPARRASAKRSAMARPIPRDGAGDDGDLAGKREQGHDDLLGGRFGGARLHAADPGSVAGLAFPVVTSTFSHQVGEYPSVQVQADISQGTGSIESAPQRS